MPQRHRPTIVAIVASAGGIDQLRLVLGILPPDLDTVVLVTTHRPADRVSHLRETLAGRSRMPVAEAAEGERLLAGRC